MLIIQEQTCYQDTKLNHYQDTQLNHYSHNTRTDTNTVHSYLPMYEQLLNSKKETAQSILEVGILDGGSINLWSDYFQNANVHGNDIIHVDNVWEDIKNK